MNYYFVTGLTRTKCAFATVVAVAASDKGCVGHLPDWESDLLYPLATFTAKDHRDVVSLICQSLGVEFLMMTGIDADTYGEEVSHAY